MTEEVVNQLVRVDGIFSPELIRDAGTFWPAPDDPAWVRYDSVIEKKRALHHWKKIPDPCKRLLQLMLALLPEKIGFERDLFSDMGLYGGGLHEHGPGEFLSGHLDADRHPETGMERRLNALLFLDDWHEDWGGHLELWSADRRTCTDRILPAAGRLVLFATTDTSYHQVARVTCPEGILRRSLAVYWWGLPPNRPGKRPRAQFVHLGDGPPLLEEERARKERMRT